MIEIPFVTEILEKVAPIGVTVEVELRKDKYYVIIDGTNTYENPEKWEKHWGGFAYFANAQMKAHSHYKPKQLTKTRIEYKIGNIMDILKNT